MPAERRQVVSRITSPANGASVRPSRRRTTALPSAAAATATSVDFGRNTRSSAEFTRGLDDAAAAAAHNAAHNHNAAGNTQPHPHAHSHAHTHPHPHNRTLSSSGFGGTGATTTTTAVHHRSRPSISRTSRPQSVYQIVEAYRPLAYSIEKAEQEAKAAAAEKEKRRSIVLSPLQTTMMTQPVPLAEDDDAMDIDEFGQFSPATPTTASALLTPSNGNNNQFEDDDFAVLRSPTRGKHQEECISGRGMLKRGYHIILDTPLENSEEARWAAIKRMEAQLRELDKSFTRVAPPSRRRITNVTNHASASTTTTAPSPASFSAANRAAWNI